MTSGSERRQHPRYSPGGLFRVYGGDAREETAHATDQGPGGAFLPVRRAMPDGTLLILDVYEPEAVHRGPPVLLVAEVVYSKQEPVLGVGIRWKHALCLEGLERLSKFLETHFTLFLDPQKIGAFHREQLDSTIQYDFQFGTVRPVPEETLEKWRGEDKIFDIKYPQTFLGKADHIETRARATGFGASPAPVPPPEIGRDEVEVDETWEPPEIRFDDNDSAGGTAPLPSLQEEALPPEPAPPAPQAAAGGVEEVTDLGFDDFTTEAPSTEIGELTSELTEWAAEMRHRMRVKVPVLLLAMAGDETIGGTVRTLSRTSLFVLVDEARVFRGDRMVVRFPLSLGPLSVKLVFVGTVMRIARDRKSGRLGLDFTIDTVDEGRNLGIFKEFVTALQRRVT